MSSFAQLADLYHLTADLVVASIFLAGQFDNHLWRFIVMFLAPTANLCLPTHAQLPWYGMLPLLVLIFKVPLMRRRQKRAGSIFVTGCDSGMGKETALYLAGLEGYDTIFAGCFMRDQSEKDLHEALKQKGISPSKIVAVALDVTKDASVAQAAKDTAKHLEASKSILSGLICFHGVAFNGPIEYMPIDMFTRQIDVNFIGNIRCTQEFLPLIKAALKSDKAQGRRGRMIFTGTGGGACSPCPSLLSAYMSSKFANEAYVQSLRMELHMTGQDIDCCVINPGFVKPTMLMEEGKKLTDKMWHLCEQKMGSSVAKDVYGRMFDHFVKYSVAQPGTHVSFIAKAADDALTAHRPWTSYKVGPDSKAAPIVGMFPTGLREWVARNGMYGLLCPVGTVPGYTV